MAFPNSRRHTSGQSLPPMQSHNGRRSKPVAPATTRVTPATLNTSKAVTTIGVKQQENVEVVTGLSNYDVLRKKYDGKRDVRPSRPANFESPPTAFFMTETDTPPSLVTPTGRNTCNRDLLISSDPLLSFTPPHRRNTKLTRMTHTPPSSRDIQRSLPHPLSDPLPHTVRRPVTPLASHSPISNVLCQSPTLASIAKPDPSARANCVPPMSSYRPLLPVTSSLPVKSSMPTTQVPRRLPYPRHLAASKSGAGVGMEKKPTPAIGLACSTPATMASINTPAITPAISKPCVSMNVTTISAKALSARQLNCLIPLPSLSLPVTRTAVEPRVPALPIDGLYFIRAKLLITKYII